MFVWLYLSWNIRLTINTFDHQMLLKICVSNFQILWRKICIQRDHNTITSNFLFNFLHTLESLSLFKITAICIKAKLGTIPNVRQRPGHHVGIQVFYLCPQVVLQLVQIARRGHVNLWPAGNFRYTIQIYFWKSVIFLFILCPNFLFRCVLTLSTPTRRNHMDWDPDSEGATLVLGVPSLRWLFHQIRDPEVLSLDLWCDRGRHPVRGGRYSLFFKMRCFKVAIVQFFFQPLFEEKNVDINIWNNFFPWESGFWISAFWTPRQ